MQADLDRFQRFFKEVIKLTDFPKYPYIRDEAKRGGTGLTETELRRMLARGELPGFYCGAQKKYFRVNHEALLELLNNKSSETGG